MGQEKKILLIDDEEDFCFFVKGHLENTGQFSVQSVNCGQEGIKLAKKIEPDLILLDIVMSDISGDEVAIALMEDPATHNIPLIFLTALASESPNQKSFPLQKIGGRFFIAKPITKNGLVEAINHMLDTSF